MLFNKHGNGSLELYELTGTIQAGIPFDSLKAEVESASEEVRSIVGAAVFEAAQEAYDADERHDFVNAVRLPVACLAIYQYSRLSGVSHGDTGRKIKTDEGEKIPFEWMLDRDDREMRDRYYRALDRLLLYLESNEISQWNGQRRVAGCIVKRLDAFEAVYPLEHSHYMFARLVPLMEEVQPKLGNIVGSARLADLVAGRETDIAPIARRYVILRALRLAVERWSLDAFPLAIARRFSPSYQGNRESRAATTDEIDWYLGKLDGQVKETALELQSAVSGNPYDGARLLPENNPHNKYFTV